MEINSQFRRLDEQGIREYIRIGGLAYPFMNLNTPEDHQRQADRYLKMQNEDDEVNVYGAYREDRLVGGMVLQDFLMNFNGTELKSGGVGFVAVDLIHKKERIAKDIISFFIDYYRKQKVAMAILYPFRPDFYRQMGFGFGTKMNQYRIKPATLPKVEKKGNVQYLTEADKEQAIECYNIFAAQNHGMLKRTNIEKNNVFAPGKTTVVYKNGDKMEGFVSFFFRKASDINPVKNDIIVKELIFNSLEALRQLLSFLHIQFDQINRIVINTQNEHFHYLLQDPRDESDNSFVPVYHQSNIQGVGLMYRIIDIEEFFRQLKEYNFNNQSVRLKLNIKDSFVEENNKPVVVEFREGKVTVIEDDSYDAELSMDISDFSAMVMGSVSFRGLLKLGLADISSLAYAGIVDELFKTNDKPICTTVF